MAIDKAFSLRRRWHDEVVTDEVFAERRTRK